MQDVDELLLPDLLSVAWLRDDFAGSLTPDAETLAWMRAFCLDKWRERAADRGLSCPSDLSSSCKFTSLFARAFFGGSLEGNELHQFLVVDDEVVDLNVNAQDVAMMDDPHAHDPGFFGNPEHIEALESCIPRVNIWISEACLVLDHEIPPTMRM